MLRIYQLIILGDFAYHSYVLFLSLTLPETRILSISTEIEEVVFAVLVA